MGGRQPKKKEKKVNVEARPAEAENITVGAKVAMATFPEERLKFVAALADTRIDDPRVSQISPKEEQLVIGRFDVRTDRSGPSHTMKFKELKDSLVEEGQQRPIIVTPRGEELWVVSGNTRVEAARKAKLDNLYILKADLTDPEAWYLSLYANLDNRLPIMSLSQEEEANGIEKLIEEYQWTQEQVAKHLHRDPGWVSRKRRILKVDPYLDLAVENGRLTSSHLEVIITLPRDIQNAVADAISYCDDDGNEQILSVAGTQKMVNALKPLVKGKTPKELDELYYGDALDEVLDPENYLEKVKAERVEAPAKIEEEQPQSAKDKETKIKPGAGISEQLFGKHISGEVPAAVETAAGTSTETGCILPAGVPTPESNVIVLPSPPAASVEDLEMAENLDSIAAAAPEEPAAETTINCATGVKTSTVQRIVNKAGSTVFKLVCPCCDEPLILDPLKMVANWQQDLKED